jgi:predicted transcriptional regulator
LPTRRPDDRKARNSGNAAGTKTSSANSTADRAIDILLLFTEERPTWLMAEIAAHFDMPRSTIYRYLASLRSYALIVEDDRADIGSGRRSFRWRRPPAPAHQS